MFEVLMQLSIKKKKNAGEGMEEKMSKSLSICKKISYTSQQVPLKPVLMVVS